MSKADIPHLIPHHQSGYLSLMLCCLMQGYHHLMPQNNECPLQILHHYYNCLEEEEVAVELLAALD